jgi:hypothetical protein
MAVSQNVANRLSALRDRITAGRDRSSAMIERVGNAALVATQAVVFNETPSLPSAYAVSDLPDHAKAAASEVAKLMAGRYKFANVQATAFAYTPAQDKAEPALTQNA